MANVALNHNRRASLTSVFPTKFKSIPPKQNHRSPRTSTRNRGFMAGARRLIERNISFAHGTPHNAIGVDLFPVSSRESCNKKSSSAKVKPSSSAASSTLSESCVDNSQTLNLEQALDIVRNFRDVLAAGLQDMRKRHAELQLLKAANILQRPKSFASSEYDEISSNNKMGALTASEVNGTKDIIHSYPPPVSGARVAKTAKSRPFQNALHSFFDRFRSRKKKIPSAEDRPVEKEKKRRIWLPGLFIHRWN